MQLKPIAMIAVLVLIVTICGCDGNRNEQTIQANSNTPTGTNTPAGATTVSVTATSLGSSSTLTSSYGTITAAVSGNKFVKYAVYLQNNNAKGIQMGNAGFFKLRDTKGNLYSYDISTFTQEQ